MMWQQYIYLPPGVDGQLNWIGGFIQLDASVEEFESLIALVAEPEAARREPVNPRGLADSLTIMASEERGRPLGTYWHEVIHYAQTITMSYLYKWTYTLLVQVLDSISDARGQDIGQLIGSESPIIFDPGELPPVKKARGEALLDHLARLDVRGSSGLSPRMIFESHAFITQYRLTSVHVEESGEVLSTREVLDGFCPSDTYRVAFDFVRYLFGEEPAEIIFIPAAALSLGTDDPVATFERIVLTAAGDSGVHAAVGADDSRQVYANLRRLVEHYETAPQTYLANPSLFHPIYSDQAKLLVDHLELVDRFFAEPENSIHEILEVTTPPPTLGSPTADGIPFLFIPDALQDGEGRSFLHATISFAAHANAVLGSAYNYEEASPRQTKSLHWLTRPSHAPMWIPMNEEVLTSGDISGIRSLLEPQHGRFIEFADPDPQDSRPGPVFVPAGRNEPFPTFEWFELTWGRFWFPRDEDEGRERLWVSFVKKLVAELPKALAYLDLASPWIQEMLRLSLESELEDANPDLILHMAERVVAIGEHGTEVGVDPWIQARLLTAWLPDDLGDLLLQHPTLSQVRSK